MLTLDGRLQTVAGIVALLRRGLASATGATPPMPATAVIADWPLPGLGPTVGMDLAATPPQIPLLVVVSAEKDAVPTRGQQGLASGRPFLPVGAAAGTALTATGRMDLPLTVIVAAAGPTNRRTAGLVAAAIRRLLPSGASVPIPDALDSDAYLYGLRADLLLLRDREVSHEAARGVWRRELDYTATYTTYNQVEGARVTGITVRRDDPATGAQTVIARLPS